MVIYYKSIEKQYRIGERESNVQGKNRIFAKCHRQSITGYSFTYQCNILNNAEICDHTFSQIVRFSSPERNYVEKNTLIYDDNILS